MHLLLLAAHWLNAYGPTPSPPHTPIPTVHGVVPTSTTTGHGHGGGGYGLGSVLGAGLAGLGVGAGAIWYGARDRSPRPESPATSVGQAAAAWENEGRDRAWNSAGAAGSSGLSGAAGQTAAAPGAADRDQLIQALIDLADRLRDSDRTGLWKTANRHLEAVGVRVHIADGQRFDPAAHHAGGYIPTDLPEHHLTVASTEECGYSDHGRVIRRPRVIVYRAPGDSRAG